MPKIPIYERQVQIQRPTIKTPDVIVNTPATAFGTGIAQGISDIGQGMSKLGQAIQYKEQQDSNALILNKLAEAKLKNQNALYSNQIEEVKNEDGSIYSRPIGIKARVLSQAQNATTDYDNISKNILDEYQKQLNPKQYDTFKKLYTNDVYLPNRDNVTTHETNQLNKYRDNQIDANIALSLESIKNNPTVENLDVNIKSTNGMILQRNIGESEEVLKLKTIENTNKMVKESVLSCLDTNNYDLAEKQLKSQNISRDLYGDLQKKIQENKQQNQELQYNNILFNRTGYGNADKAIKYIENDKNLDQISKQKQISSYMTKYRQEESILSDKENVLIDNILKSTRDLFDKTGIGSYAQATNMAKTQMRKFGYNGAEFDQNKIDNITREIDSIYNVEGGVASKKVDVDTDILTRTKVEKLIENGNVKNYTDITKNYGGSLSAESKRYLDKYLKTWNDIPDGYSISAQANKYAKDNRLNITDQALVYESALQQKQDFKLKNKRNPTALEQAKMVENTMKNVVVEKRTWLPDPKDKLFKFRYNPSTGTYIYKAKDGKILSYSKEEYEGLTQNA